MLVGMNGFENRSSSQPGSTTTSSRIRGAVAAGMLGVSLALTGCENAEQPAPRAVRAPAVLQVAETVAALTPVRIMTCCDSITVGIGTTSYRSHMTTLLRARGFKPVWIVTAVSSTTCTLWNSLLGDLIATNKPDILLVNCGTNDVLSSDAAITPFIVQHAGIINGARAQGVKVAVSSVQYSRVDGRPELAWLPASQFRVNTAIGFTAFAYGDVAYADVVAIPATPENNPDGIHPGTLGDKLYASAWISAGAAKGWWAP